MMITMRKFRLSGAIILMVLLAISLPSCGEDKNACVEFCKTVEQKMIDQLPDVSPGFCTRDPEFSQAKTCEECEQVFLDLYEVSFTDTGNCGGFF